jgi:DNA-binding CsgD family transcriptional regulator
MNEEFGRSGGAITDAVEAIYDAAAQPEKWPDALQAIAASLGDVGANLTYERDDGTFGAIVSPGLAAGSSEYSNKWFQHDIRAARFRERRYLLGTDVLTDDDLITAQEMATHPFYTDFLARFGLRWCATVSITPDPHVIVNVTVQRSASKQPFNDDERTKLRSLGRHCEKSLRLGIRLLGDETINFGLREVLAGIGMGVFVLDGMRRIIYSNSAVDALIGDGLKIASGRLTVSLNDGRAAFNGAISATLRYLPGDVPIDPAPILLSRSRSDRRLVVYVLPLRTSAIEQFLIGARLIVLVIDPSSRENLDPAVIRDLFGLTLGEARVAALIGAGLTPRAASEKLGIAEDSIRTVLKRVFAKTGVGRQNELTALVTRLIVPRAPPHRRR